MTTKYKIPRAPIPLSFIVLLILIIAVGFAAWYLGGGNITTGLVTIAEILFVGPMQWGSLSLVNGMLVIGVIIGATAVIIFLYTKRRYLKGTTVELPATIPLQSQLKEPLLQSPPQQQEEA